MHGLAPSDLRLPFLEWRPTQLSCLTTLGASSKRFLIVQAPPGIGKSGLAVSLRRLLSARTVILTSTKALQDQYETAFGPELRQARGRPNFQCNITPSVSASDALCSNGGRCRLANTPECDYYAQKIEAEHSEEAVLNYAYWLHQVNWNKSFKPELLVCDEAHLIEEELRRFVSIKLLWSVIKALKLEAPRPTLDAWVRWAWANAETIHNAGLHYRAGSPMRTKIKRFQDAIWTLEHDVTEENWTMTSDKWGVEFRPVWVDKYAQEYMFSHSEKILMLSATILDQELFCESLGIPVGEVEFVAIPSAFPQSRRPIYYCPVGKVGRAAPHVQDELVRRLDDLMDREAGRGLVHTVNYALARYIMENSRHATRLLSHTTQDRAQALATYRQTPGAVLVSPSMGTGVDLPYDLCDWQAIAKLPFPDLSDPQIKKRIKIGPDGKLSKRGSRWSNWVTACALVQAYGRGMRAEDDSCRTYLLDGNFGAWFLPATRRILPRWFLEALRYEQSQSPSVSVADQLKRVRAASLSIGVE